MKLKRHVRDKQAAQALAFELVEAFTESGYLYVTASTEKPRSLDQNAISHTWYEQIARELHEDTPEGVKSECKLRYGVPILRADDEDFRKLYDSALKPLPYDQKLAIMHLIPVTSLMNTDQLSRYLGDVQKAYSGRVQLKFPEDY